MSGYALVRLLAAEGCNMAEIIAATGRSRRFVRDAKPVWPARRQW